MSAMSASYWNQVLADGLTVPEDRPLGDLTAELTRMLGDPDPGRRDEIALQTLAAWIERGVYDDLLVGLGDGMSEGLRVGIETPGTDDVFRRSFSALVLGVCLERANAEDLLGRSTVLDWGDRLATWLLREQDLRGFVEGKGWAHAVAHGADAIGALGGSPHLEAPELTVLLDVLADRVLAERLPGQAPLDHGELDRLAIATLRLLRRDLLPLSVLEPWVNRVATVATEAMAGPVGQDPYPRRNHAEGFLRALYVQLALTTRPPAVRADLVLVVVDALRRTNHAFLT